jgi:hypothetical protein
VLECIPPGHSCVQAAEGGIERPVDPVDREESELSGRRPRALRPGQREPLRINESGNGENLGNVLLPYHS